MIKQRANCFHARQIRRRKQLPAFLYFCEGGFFMKKAILKTSGMLLVVGLAFTAMLFGCRHKAEPKTGAEQQTESVNPAIFTTDGNGKITGYTCSKEELPKNLVIPAKIGDEVITSIGYCAFFGCSGLTSVSLSSCTSLTSIGGGAFSGCSGLTSVSFPASLTSIGSEAFYCCTGLTSMSFPASLTSIGEKAFIGCSGLTSVSLSSCTSLTSIGSEAFYNCSGLTSVSFPASLTSIGEKAFIGCSGLTSVTVDNGNSTYKAVDNVVYTKDRTTLVFAAGGLTSVTIPSTVTSIGNFAFSGCSGLTSVNFPASLISIGRYAFSGCSGLTSVTVDDGNSTYKAVDNVVYTKDGTTLVFAAGGLTSVTIPNTVTSIGNSAFDGCTGLTSVSFPASLTSIGKWAFSECSCLTSVSFPASLTSIGTWAFSRCDNLTSATFADATGWAVYNDYKYKNRDSYIQQSDLQNPATAVEYLRNTYREKYWKKN